MPAAGSWDRLLASACERSGTPGAVLGVWHRGSRTVVPYGVLNTRTGVRTTGESVFQIGSITKTWTATILAQFVEEGRLSLDSTVSDLLPGVRLGADDLAEQVTVRHLLTHSSGLDGDVFTDTGRGDDAVERYVAGLHDVAVVHAPGQAYSYCNTGFVLLGRIIEVLDGTTWEESLRRRLVEPWDLPDVCTLPEEAIVRRAAAGHRGGEVVEPWGMPRSLGAAGLVTTTAAALLAFGRRWLGEDVPPHLERMTDPLLEVPDGDDVDAVGLAWRLGTWAGHRVLGHSGGTNGQTAQLHVVPGLDLVVCVLTNSDAVNAVHDTVVPQVVADLTGVTVPSRPAPDPGAVPHDPTRHVGVYERRAVRLDVRADAAGLSVHIQPTGDFALGTPETVRLLPCDASGDRYVARSQDSEPWTPFTFSTLPDGTPQLFFSSRVAPLLSRLPRVDR
ncbi:serine hydrolase domain-containing protein [Nocardioides sp.]|uniref:serine hydrolase domain-containing protein n=1 Tax=Nocardioides sp. TaxID=35761 RepID=UPI00321ADAD3